MGNSYCKKDYKKGAVIVFEITQVKLQKRKKYAAMTSFCCLVSKIWEKITLCCCKKGKKRLVCVVS